MGESGSGISWPELKRFAFTVFDDTDHTTLENGPRLYDFLFEAGFRTTKSVWPVKGARVPKIGGATCADPDYLAWVKNLQKQGFEIALHNATYHTSTREVTIDGLEKFKTYFGAYPKIHVNHSGCEDGIYWGDARLTGANKFLYNLLTRYRNKRRFGGTDPTSNLFWGDRCQRDVKYVRNFVYTDVNTLKACPFMPYKDPMRPLVNYWFASSEGPTCSTFCRTISEANQDRLEAEGGACIMYAHFGTAGFYEDRALNSRFRFLMERLAKKDCWFVPVSTLLDYIQNQRGEHTLAPTERIFLERKWLYEKVFFTRGTS